MSSHRLETHTLGSQRASVDNLELGSEVIQKSMGIFLIKVMQYNALQFSLVQILFSQPLTGYGWSYKPNAAWGQLTLIYTESTVFVPLGVGHFARRI